MVIANAGNMALFLSTWFQNMKKARETRFKWNWFHGLESLILLGV